MNVGCNRGVSTYTDRVAAIRAVLAKHLPLDGLVQNNRVTNPIEPLECLAVSWGTSPAAPPTLVVTVHQVDDFTEEVNLLRDVADGEAHSYEVTGPDGYALVQGKLSTVQAVVTDCAVRIHQEGIDLDLLVAPALEIAQAGWTDYTDDYVPPPLPPR